MLVEQRTHIVRLVVGHIAQIEQEFGHAGMIATVRVGRVLHPPLFFAAPDRTCLHAISERIARRLARCIASFNRPVRAPLYEFYRNFRARIVLTFEGSRNQGRLNLTLFYNRRPDATANAITSDICTASATPPAAVSSRCTTARTEQSSPITGPPLIPA